MATRAAGSSRNAMEVLARARLVGASMALALGRSSVISQIALCRSTCMGSDMGWLLIAGAKDRRGCGFGGISGILGRCAAICQLSELRLALGWRNRTNSRALHGRAG